MRIDGQGMWIEPLTLENYGPRYVAWLNDPEINRFLESRFQVQDETSVREFIAAMAASSRDHLFGIFTPAEGHVGNIKIGAIDPHHRFGDIGFLIGERAMQGRGLGTQAVALATAHAFAVLNLRKLVAGAYSTNVASARIFAKNDYRLVGTLMSHRLCEGKRVDQHLFEKLGPSAAGEKSWES
jgi:ribosomal-protein-alanine N-acetyltransferase